MTDDAWALLHDLVATPSPSGAEDRATSVLDEWLRARGLEPTLDAAGNLRCVAGSGGPRILLVGHIDCVEPFLEVRVEGDTLWGRGAVDAKGPLAAFAAVAAASVERDDFTVELIACTGEEADSRGARHLMTEGIDGDVLVIGEPSGSHAYTLGYKGRLLFEARATAPTAHAGHPEPTPAERLVQGWQRLAAALDNVDLDVGASSATPRLIEMTSSSDDMRSAVATVDLRVPVGPSDDWHAGRFHDAVKAAFETAEVRFLDEAPPYVGARGSPLATAFRSAIRGRGGEPRAVVKTGTSDLNLLGPALGVPAVAYGPGDASLDHGPEEHVTRGEFDEAVAVLGAALDVCAANL